MLEDAAGHLQRSAEAAVSAAEEIERLIAELDRARRLAASTPTPAPTEVPLAFTPVPTPEGDPVLFVDSAPSGAEVLVDNRYLGQTPVELEVVPGEHRIEVRKDGFEASSSTVSVRQGQRRPQFFSLHPLPRTEAPIPAQPTEARQPRAVPAEPTAAGPSTLAATPSRPESVVAMATVAVSDDAGAATERQQPPTAGGAHEQAQDRTVIRIVGVVVLLGLGATLGWVVRERSRTHQTEAMSESPTERFDPTQRLNDTTFSAEMGDLVREDSPASPSPQEPVRASPVVGSGPRPSTPIPQALSADFGAYTLVGMLGRGGMATTYHAERKRDGVPVAVKIPHDHLLDNPEFVHRFVREGSLGATLHHPNIIRIFEADRFAGRPFIAMELLSGQTLESKLASCGALGVLEALEITRGIALALDYAHMKGIVHRDLKPDNVMILEDATVKVMDYGIARVADTTGLTGSHSYLGTPLYSPPEAISPAEVDHRSDLYSLGIILYRMVSNRLPFESQSPYELLKMHRTEPLPKLHRNLHVPPAVEQVIARLAAKQKVARFESAEQLLQELNRIVNAM